MGKKPPNQSTTLSWSTEMQRPSGLLTGGAFGLHHTAWTIAAITLIGTVLRSQLLQTPVHADEMDFFVHHYPRGWLFTVCVYYAANNHIAYNLIVQMLGSLFGPELWVARLPAFVFGCLLVPLTARVARQLAGPRVAIYAAALIAINPLFVNYSLYARGYSLFMFLIISSVGQIDRLIKSPSRKSAILLGILWAFAAWTIPIAIHAVTFLLLWALFRIARASPIFRGQVTRELTASCVVTGVLTLMLYTPVLLVTGWRSLISDPATAPRPFSQLPAQAMEQLSDLVWISGRDYGACGWLVPLVLAIIGAVFARRRERKLVALAGCAIASQIGWLLIQRVFPFPRALMPLLWTITLVMAVGLVEVEMRVLRSWLYWKSQGSRRLALAGTIFASAVILFSREKEGLNGNWPHDFHQVAQLIAYGQQPPRLFTNYADVGINYYLLQLKSPTLVNQFTGPGEYLFLCRKSTDGLDLVSRTKPGLDPIIEILRSRGGPRLESVRPEQVYETKLYTVQRLRLPQ